MNKERMALIKDASEGKLSLNGVKAISGSVEDLEKFAKDVEEHKRKVY